MLLQWTFTSQNIWMSCVIQTCFFRSCSIPFESLTCLYATCISTILTLPSCPLLTAVSPSTRNSSEMLLLIVIVSWTDAMSSPLSSYMSLCRLWGFARRVRCSHSHTRASSTERDSPIYEYPVVTKKRTATEYLLLGTGIVSMFIYIAWSSNPYRIRHR